jgi:hypothetical protein
MASLRPESQVASAPSRSVVSQCCWAVWAAIHDPRWWIAGTPRRVLGTARGTTHATTSRASVALARCLRGPYQERTSLPCTVRLLIVLTMRRQLEALLLVELPLRPKAIRSSFVRSLMARICVYVYLAARRQPPAVTCDLRFVTG